VAPGNLQTTLLLADCELRLGQNRDVVALLKPVEQQNAEHRPSRTCWAWR